jgi:hypothetical protein
MATHREAAEEACKAIPPTTDDRLAKRGVIHALLDVADAIREHGPIPVEILDPEEAGNVAKARELAADYAGYDGEHHKQHALVQVAELLGGRVPDGTDRGIPA